MLLIIGRSASAVFGFDSGFVTSFVLVSLMVGDSVPSYLSGRLPDRHVWVKMDPCTEEEL